MNKQKTVMITGASSGIGETTAKYFAAKGWNVIATMRAPEKQKKLTHKNISKYKLDVSDYESIKSLIKQLTKQSSIDVLVNNAGFSAVGAFEASKAEQIQEQFDVNVFGLMNLVREIIPIFRKQKNGQIINVASMGGRITLPLYSVYHASKWAVEGFSESLMYELQPYNIKVKIIEPGVIKTDFNGRSELNFAKKGLHSYDDFQKKVLDNFDNSYKNGTSADKVAKVIYKAANDQSAKLRYVVGSPAPILLMLRKILPERTFYFLLRKQLGI